MGQAARITVPVFPNFMMGFQLRDLESESILCWIHSCQMLPTGYSSLLKRSAQRAEEIATGRIDRVLT